jgi:hypothetical protein
MVIVVQPLYINKIKTNYAPNRVVFTLSLALITCNMQ